MTKILCVIPSRLHSTRLPNKPLLLIQGKPMIQRVYENAIQCSKINQVIVATDDQQIAQIITDIGGSVFLTPPDLASGSDRVAFVAAECNDADIIINLQGDEPFVKPKLLEQLIAPFSLSGNTAMTTLATTLTSIADYHDPAIVKVITDLSGNAIYFSRSPIPYTTTTPNFSIVHKHIGLYAFRRDFLLTYAKLPQSPLEKVEKLEQLRVLEHGYKIKVELTTEKTLEINTFDEYQRAQSFVQEN